MNKPVSRVTAGRLESAADGRTSRWTEHRALRREELIDAAVGAINRFGADLGMDQIAACAGTSKPVIYRYFTDKNDLYRAVGARVIARIVAMLQTVEGGADPRAMLHGAIEAYLQLVEDNPQLFRFVTQHRLLSEAHAGEPTPAEFSGAVTELLTSALARQLEECGLDPIGAQPWGEGAAGFIRATSLWWLEHPEAMTRVQLTEYLGALLWGGAAGVFQSAGRHVDGRPRPGVFAPLAGPPDPPAMPRGHLPAT